MVGTWLCVLSLGSALAGCHSTPATTSGGDSDTHFLATCTDSCAGGLTCLCGVCTRLCDEQTSCGDLSAVATCENSCTSASSKVCDASCSKDADCSSLGSAFACDAGHCRQGSLVSIGSGGGGNATSSACHADPDLTPSLPTVTALDPNVVARAAAVIGSCMPDDGVARNVMHLWLSHLAAPRLYYHLIEQLECFANANCGCAAVEHCLGWTYRPEPAVCPSACNGAVFTGCGDGVQVTLDCSRLGLRCDPQAICVADSPVACDGSELPTCTPEGEVAACDDGAWRKTPCQALGFSCVAGKCLGTGASCNDTEALSSPDLVIPTGTGCVGSTLQACLGGRTAQVDCATRGPGFTCQSRDGSFFCGLAAECVASNDYSSTPTAACDGTTLSFCNAGRLEHLDCTEFGFTGCEINRSADRYGCTPGNVVQ